MPNKRLDVTLFHFQRARAVNFEGYFVMASNDSKLREIKKEINRATIELPKCQLLITTEDGNMYQVKDCWIDKFEFEKNDYEWTKCYFISNDVSVVKPTE